MSNDNDLVGQRAQTELLRSGNERLPARTRLTRRLRRCVFLLAVGGDQRRVDIKDHHIAEVALHLQSVFPWASWFRRKTKFPLLGRHFCASTRDHATHP